MKPKSIEHINDAWLLHGNYRIKIIKSLKKEIKLFFFWHKTLRESQKVLKNVRKDTFNRVYYIPG